MVIHDLDDLDGSANLVMVDLTNKVMAKYKTKPSILRRVFQRRTTPVPSSFGFLT